MKKNKTSRAWVHDHINDPYVQRAQAEGYRARAAYKLLEIDERDKLLRPGMLVVDLGSAPGSWSQVAVRRLAGRGRVVALDILPMEQVAGVEFLQGDFTDDAVLAAFEKLVGDAPVGLVMSDMAPNLSGVALTDQVRGIHLAELALEFACDKLASDGRFVVKVFQGSGFMEFRKAMEQAFAKVEVRKPKASRDRSAEVYLLGIRPRKCG
ncbi:MAG TPA: RlmE family RNA methyltransferase [Rhodocyclaceae bacterium]|nr:RlmE family RNA methyltransferase [Rhodocyclaceae bacterium]HMV53792.1 RlmE family RNA methyltransferase [Rhodocyclaceae bacterium]HMZ84123.1 RlmE family RNA methyltransferase [Rhodocyclaceae bacterium]HNA02278.1 RlmE family RNA methyltransferase [Rhodocyclaceae bacterium]HNB78304.1 RlmE family RNA methyltransferase [Rhodocyclaceae bacterium]